MSLLSGHLETAIETGLMGHHLLCERRQPIPAAVTLSPVVIAVKGPPTAHCAVAVGEAAGTNR